MKNLAKPSQDKPEMDESEYAWVFLRVRGVRACACAWVCLRVRACAYVWVRLRVCLRV